MTSHRGRVTILSVLVGCAGSEACFDASGYTRPDAQVLPTHDAPAGEADPASAAFDSVALGPSSMHRAAVEALVKPILQGQWVSSMVVGLISEQGHEFYAFGTLDDSGKTPDQHTLWEIGSITKTFTNLLLAKFVSAGELALDQPVQTLLPSERVRMPTRNAQQITLVQLATHSSGLPGIPDNLAQSAADHPDDPYADYSEALLFDFLNAYQLARDPGSDWEYSNLAGGLLGHALALHAQQPWAALVADLIGGPLALPDTVVTLSDGQRARFAQPHDADLVAVPEWTFDVLAPAGALRSTALDMADYLALQAGITHSDPLDSAVAFSHQARFDIPSSSGLTGNQMGLGWLLRDGRFLWHNGGTGGSGSFVGADPVSHTGVLVLSNTASEVYEPQTQLGHALQALLAGVEPLDVTLPPTPRSLPVAILDRYAGDFTLVEGSDSAPLSVVREAGSLYARLAGGHPQRLQATSDTSFYTRWLPVTLTFHGGETRAADFWTIEQEGSVLTAWRD